jgi:hypothetical protein
LAYLPFAFVNLLNPLTTILAALLVASPAAPDTAPAPQARS